MNPNTINNVVISTLQSITADSSLEFIRDTWKLTHGLLVVLQRECGVSYSTETVNAIISAMVVDRAKNYPKEGSEKELVAEFSAWCAEDLLGVLAEELRTAEIRIKVEEAVNAARQRYEARQRRAG